MNIVSWFSDLGRADLEVAGGKGANLGELTRAGLPVPPGFVITAPGYLQAMDEGGVRQELRSLFAEARSHSDDPVALASDADRLRSLVHKAGVPTSVRDEVLAAYHRLGDQVPVAVRSSATGEDTAGTSFAGMHETFANVVGDDSVIERLSDCWASLYGERVISYRTARGIVDEPSIAVVVQVLVDADRAGVLFTADPSTGNRSNLVIEGAFGLGEVVVSGQVEVDTYTLSEVGPRMLQTRIGRKDHKIVGTANGGVERIDLADDEAFRRVLTDEEAIELAATRSCCSIALRRRAPRHRMGDRRRQDVHPSGATDHELVHRIDIGGARQRHRRRRSGARPRVGSVRGHRDRAGEGSDVTTRRWPAPRGRGSRRADDQSRLGPYDASGIRSGDRQWRNDVPRRDHHT